MFHSGDNKVLQTDGQKEREKPQRLLRKQKEQRDLCRRDALQAGSDFTGDQLAPPRWHKGPAVPTLREAGTSGPGQLWSLAAACLR